MNQRIIANELVPVYETPNGEKVVSGRELHSFLQIGRDFTTWFTGRCQKYGFSENEDFTPILGKTSEQGGRPSMDFIMKLDMAKELSMVENNEQGSRARKYFIEVERRYRSQVIDLSQLSPELQMFKQIWDGLAQAQIEQTVVRQLVQTQGDEIREAKSTITEMRDTLLQRDEDWREYINGMLRAAARRSGGIYRELRNESYSRLEERARCDLNKRLRNLRDRLHDGGSTKTRIEETNRMDVIEAEPRLREIYTAIVKELAIGTIGGNVS